MEKVWCPACNQGWVLEVRVKSTGELLKLCGECDTVWLSGEVVGDVARDFELYMQEQGLKGLWTEIDVLSPDGESSS